MATIATATNATRALVILLGAAVFLNYVDRGAIGIAAPLMKTDLGLSDEAYGVVFSAFFWIYAPVQQVMSLWPFLVVQNPNALVSLLPALTIVLPLLVQSGLQAVVGTACWVFTLRRAEHLSE